MAKPTEGKVIEISTPADVSEVALEDACRAMTYARVVPQILTVGLDDFKHYAGLTLFDMAQKSGLKLVVDRKYEDSEWTVDDDAEPGKDRTTFWSPGAG